MMPLDKETYFPRIDQYRNWYDNKAVQAKAKYLRAKILSAICAVLVPIIVNVSSLPVLGDVAQYTNAIVTVMGAFVAVMLAAENVLKYREQWVNYRSTEQFLTREKILFEAMSGPYKGLSEEEAHHRFIGVCEDAIQNENQATLNTLTRDETSNSKSGA